MPTPGQKFLPHLLLQLERVKMAENRTGQTKKAANLFQDLLLSLAASRRAGIQFLWLVRRIVKPELELAVN